MYRSRQHNICDTLLAGYSPVGCSISHRWQLDQRQPQPLRLDPWWAAQLLVATLINTHFEYSTLMFKFHKLSLGNLQTRKKTCFAFSYSFLHIYFSALQSVRIHLGQVRGNEEGGGWGRGHKCLAICWPKWQLFSESLLPHPSRPFRQRTADAATN